MNIGLYGVSRSGKNYLIERLMESLNKKCENTLIHINGSGTLDKLSNELFGIPLKNANENQKTKLRILFCDRLIAGETGYRHKIVDGHYSFYKNGKLETVFTDSDRDIYDVFFYIDTPAEIIIKQANKDHQKKDVAFMSIEQINAWKDFEIQSLRKMCYDQSKEFVVLDNNVEECIDFFETLLLETRDVLLNSKKIAELVLSKHENVFNKYNNVVLLDCDRTLSNNDTTYDFCNILGIENTVLKDIFHGEHYSLYQFFRVAKIYSKYSISDYKRASIYAMGKMQLNMHLVEDINKNGANYLSVGITSGVLGTWESVVEQYNFPSILIGGSNFNSDKYIISRAVKYYLVKLLKDTKKQVIAVGDSMVDFDMLNVADKGFLVAQEKINSKIKVIFENSKTDIMQLEYNQLHYKGIEVKRSMFL
ncbi:MAG: hypothetical protein FWG66_07450 [Spirochaetes bacterium]|nr:hypothetical protein [Spirochaetota bacterium]